MATCPNGHTNPENQEFCRECGAPIMSAVVTCPHGHINPEHAHFCEECGAPLTAPVAAVPASSATRPWYRKKWVIAAASLVGILLIAGGIVVAVVATTGKNTPSAPTTSAATAIKNWWSGAQQDFSDLQNALNDSRRALNRTPMDWSRLEDACGRMHDAAENKLKARLPTPDPELTADVQGMIEDFHGAAHNCLSAYAGASEQIGEFTSLLDQAEKQMRAAEDVVNNVLAQA